MRPSKRTLFGFVQKNRMDLFVKQTRRFDGMTDGMEVVHGFFTPVDPERVIKAYDPESNDFGIPGLYMVGRGNDYIAPYKDATYEGFEVDNCCGHAIVVTRRKNEEKKV